jgi:hypothetical protein
MFSWLASCGEVDAKLTTMENLLKELREMKYSKILLGNKDDDKEIVDINARIQKLELDIKRMKQLYNCT